MKNSILALAALALISLASACSSSAADEAAMSEMQNRDDVVTLSVSGMT